MAYNNVSKDVRAKNQLMQLIAQRKMEKETIQVIVTKMKKTSKQPHYKVAIGQISAIINSLPKNLFDGIRAAYGSTPFKKFMLKHATVFIPMERNGKYFSTLIGYTLASDSLIEPYLQYLSCENYAPTLENSLNEQSMCTKVSREEAIHSANVMQFLTNVGSTGKNYEKLMKSEESFMDQYVKSMVFVNSKVATNPVSSLWELEKEVIIIIINKIKPKTKLSCNELNQILNTLPTNLVTRLKTVYEQSPFKNFLSKHSSIFIPFQKDNEKWYSLASDDIIEQRLKREFKKAIIEPKVTNIEPQLAVMNQKMDLMATNETEANEAMEIKCLRFIYDRVFPTSGGEVRKQTLINIILSQPKNQLTDYLSEVGVERFLDRHSTVFPSTTSNDGVRTLIYYNRISKESFEDYIVKIDQDRYFPTFTNSICKAKVFFNEFDCIQEELDLVQYIENATNDVNFVSESAQTVSSGAVSSIYLYPA